MRSRKRKRSRSRSESKETRIESMKLQVERLVKKMKYVESGRKWNNVANEKQYIYNVELWQIVIEDYKMVLEEYFRSKKVPDMIEQSDTFHGVTKFKMDVLSFDFRK